MRHAVVLPILIVTALAAATAPAGAVGWRSQQPDGPGGFPTLLGKVGDVECLAADRCLLTTAGNTGVPAGLFAYDGRGWYRYATVCGGEEGRIAWVGPDEFWTIADQQKGQQTGKAPPAHISLCHFKGNQVVASYAEPVGVADSYLPMNAAACSGPSDCWFAGARLPGTVNQGAFHLHWDGASLTATPALTSFQLESLDPGRSVGSLAYHQGNFYESVLVRGGDVPIPGEEEPEPEPSLLHRIRPGATSPFEPLFPGAPFGYGEEGAEARELGVMRLTGEEGQPLWAIAGANGSRAAVTVLRLGAGDEITQLPLSDPGAVLEPGDPVSGAAAEPGDAAWIAFQRASDVFSTTPPARLTRVHDDGAIDPEVMLPAVGEEVGGEVVGPKGQAGPVACPGAEQCWMATVRGWLFHLGPDPAPNADPALRPAPITFRPPDHSLPVVPPTSPPEDDSGANQPRGSEQEEIPSEFDQLPRRRPPIVANVQQRLIHGTILELSFTLRKKALVRLVAKRTGHVIAKTRRYTMAKGRHSLRLRLDPKRWPTKLDLQVHAAAERKSK
jgi:hypothetical protein